VYLADNGWIQDPAVAKYALRSKRSPYEGGIRTPIILRWPAQLKPRRDESSLVSSLDLAPTILAACGIMPSAEMKGLNLLDVATRKVKPHETVFGEIYEHDVADLDRAEPGLLYRWCISGTWKLIAPQGSQDAELYNLAHDPQEKKDLASQQPDRVKQLL